MTYRGDRRLGGTDISRAAKDFDAWAAERRLRLADQWPVWLEDETDAMAFGTLVHKALLEPEDYARCAVVMPYVQNFALKEGRAVKSEALAKAEAIENGFIVRHEHAWALDIMRPQFNEIAKQLGPYETEKTLFGDKIKGRVDIITANSIVDLKTTRDIMRCDSTALYECYHFQISHYAELADRPSGAYIFIENVFPYRMVYKVISREDFDLVNEARRALMSRIEAEGLI